MLRAAAACAVFFAFAAALSPAPLAYAADRLLFDYPPIDLIAVASAILAATAFGLAAVRFLAGEPSRPGQFLQRQLQRLGRPGATDSIRLASALPA